MEKLIRNEISHFVMESPDNRFPDSGQMYYDELLVGFAAERGLPGTNLAVGTLPASTQGNSSFYGITDTGAAGLLPRRCPSHHAADIADSGLEILISNNQCKILPPITSVQKLS